jgi:hypothetical protein
MRNVDPFPSVDSTQMWPPCISTICLGMASVFVTETAKWPLCRPALARTGRR